MILSVLDKILRLYRSIFEVLCRSQIKCHLSIANLASSCVGRFSTTAVPDSIAKSELGLAVAC